MCVCVRVGVRAHQCGFHFQKKKSSQGREQGQGDALESAIVIAITIGIGILTDIAIGILTVTDIAIGILTDLHLLSVGNSLGVGVGFAFCILFRRFRSCFVFECLH